MDIRQKENLLIEIEELTRRTLRNYPSYFMSREDEITESIGDERDELINEIYFEYVSSETQDLFGFLDSLISEEDYNISDNVKQSLNEFKEGILNLRMEWNTYYYLDDLYEEYLSQLKNSIFNSNKVNTTLDVIKHYRANKSSMHRCDELLNSYK